MWYYINYIIASDDHLVIRSYLLLTSSVEMTPDMVCEV